MKIEEKLVYLFILITLVFVIIIDSSYELSKNASEE